MIDVPASTTVLLIELVVATTSLCVFITVAGWNRWRKRRAVIVALVKRLKAGGQPRLEKLNQILTEPGSLDAATASDLAEKILRLETKLYQNLIGGLLDLTGAPLLNLDQHVEALVGEITKTTPLTLGATSTPSHSEPVSSHELGTAASANEGFVKLERDNAELKASIEALRAELHTLAAAGPIAKPHADSSTAGGNESQANNTPSMTNQNTLGVQELDLDFSETLAPQSASPAVETPITPINAPTIEAKESAPEELDLPMSTVNLSKKPAAVPLDNAPRPDDQIAAMPDDWINDTALTSSQGPLTVTDSSGETISPAPNSPSQINVLNPPPEPVPDEVQSLDEVLQAVAPQSTQGPRAGPEQQPIPVDIDPDAFLDSLLNDAKQTSLNVITSTSPPSGKKPGKSNGDDSTIKPAGAAMDNKKTANPTSNPDKSAPSSKTALEAELEDLLN